MNFGSPEYLKSLDSFLNGYKYLVDFKLFGYNFEMIFYIRPNDGSLDGSRTESMYIHRKTKNKLKSCLLHG